MIEEVLVVGTGREKDPDGRKLRALLQTHFALERAQSFRDLLRPPRWRRPAFRSAYLVARPASMRFEPASLTLAGWLTCLGALSIAALSGGPTRRRRSAALRKELAPAGSDRRATMSAPGPLVLVVEDEPQMRRFLRASLTSHGYQLCEASSATEAVALATSRAPELVLLDLGLPDEDGVDADAPAARMVARRRSSSSPRAGARRTRSTVLDAGADDYLTKPFGVGRAAGADARRAPPRAAGRGRADADHRDRAAAHRSRAARGEAATTPRST